MIYKDIKDVQTLVFKILYDQEATRSSDSLLYYKVLEVYGDRKGIDINSISIPRFFLQMAGEFPNYETVRRSRQKVQAKYPELSANDAVKGFRTQNEETYREFARSAE